MERGRKEEKKRKETDKDIEYFEIENNMADESGKAEVEVEVELT